MDTRDGEIANRNKIPSRRSNESQVHFRFVEHWLVLDAWIIDPGTMSILIAIFDPFGGNSLRRAPKFGTTRRSAPKSFALRAAALAKNRRADAHQRRAFLDRNSE